MRVSVNWETDGINADLPKEVDIPEGIEEDEIADWLSDKYGWLVNSFTIIQ